MIIMLLMFNQKGCVKHMSEPAIWIISDTHFNHNKEFLYSPRGFNSVEEMNHAIVTLWNECVNDDDIVYHLGDVCLGDI